jgi:hypothetical protein
MVRELYLCSEVRKNSSLKNFTISLTQKIFDSQISRFGKITRFLQFSFFSKETFFLNSLLFSLFK